MFQGKTTMCLIEYMLKSQIIKYCLFMLSRHFSSPALPRTCSPVPSTYTGPTFLVALICLPALNFYLFLTTSKHELQPKLLVSESTSWFKSGYLLSVYTSRWINTTNSFCVNEWTMNSSSCKDPVRPPISNKIPSWILWRCHLATSTVTPGEGHET